MSELHTRANNIAKEYFLVNYPTKLNPYTKELDAFVSFQVKMEDILSSVNYSDIIAADDAKSRAAKICKGINLQLDAMYSDALNAELDVLYSIYEKMYGEIPEEDVDEVNQGFIHYIDDHVFMRYEYSDLLL